MQCGINFNWTYLISVAELNLIDQSKVLDKNQELVVPIEIQAELTEPMTEQESKIQYDEVGWEEGKEDEDSEKRMKIVKRVKIVKLIMKKLKVHKLNLFHLIERFYDKSY